MQPCELDFTDSARVDLLEIEIYTEIMWGESQARTYLQDIDRSIGFVLIHPKSAPLYDDEAFGVRTRTTREHQIHYIVQGNTLTILRLQGPGQNLTRDDLEKLLPGNRDLR